MQESVDKSLKTVVKGAGFIVFGIAGSTFLWFVIKVIIARHMTKEELGVYSLVITVVSVCSLLAAMGLTEGTTRYVSIFLGSGRREDAQAISKAALRMAFVSGLAVFGVLFLAAGPIARHIFYKPEIVHPLRAVSVFIPSYVLILVLSGMLRGYGMINQRVYYRDIGQPLLFLLFFGVSFLAGLPFVSVFYSYALAGAIVALGIASYAYKKVGLNPVDLSGGGFAMELLKCSLPLLALETFDLIFTWTDTLMLGRYGNSEDVGVYNIGISLAKFLTAAVSSVGFVFMPMAGELYATNRMEELKRIYQILTKWTFYGTLPIFFILFLFSEMTITFLFGARYIDAALPLKVLSFGFMYMTFWGINVVVMVVLGLSGRLARITAFGALLNIALNYLLIKRAGMGTLGAAIAAASTVVFISSAYSYVLYRVSGIHPITSKYLKPIASMSAVALLVYVIVKSLPFYYWMMPIYFLLYVAGYVLSLFVTRSVDFEDLSMLESILGRLGIEAGGLMRLARRLAGVLPHP